MIFWNLQSPPTLEAPLFEEKETVDPGLDDLQKNVF